MPKFIVDIYAEGENDQWYLDFMEDQLNLSAGSVSIKQIESNYCKDQSDISYIRQQDQKTIAENKAAIRLLRSCIDCSKLKLQHTIIKYMNDAVDTLEKNIGAV